MNTQIIVYKLKLLRPFNNYSHYKYKIYNYEFIANIFNFTIYHKIKDKLNCIIFHQFDIEKFIKLQKVIKNYIINNNEIYNIAEYNFNTSNLFKFDMNLKSLFIYNTIISTQPLVIIKNEHFKLFYDILQDIITFMKKVKKIGIRKNEYI